MYQVHKNVQFALNILKNPDMTGLPKSLLLPVSARHNRSHGTSISEEDVLDCLPEDVVTGRVSIWLILQRVHTAYRMSAERQQRVRSRSRSPGRAIRRSVTPNTTIVAVAPPPPPVAGDKSGGASKKTERILDTAHEPAASASPIEYNRRSAALDSTSATHDTSLTSAEMKAASVAVTSTADPRRREPPLHLTTSGVIKRDRTQLHQPAWDGTMTPKRGRSWREVQLWGKGPARRARSSSPRRGNHLLRKLSATVDPVASTEILLHSNINSRPSSIRRSGSRQDVPGLTELDSDIASRDAFLPVTHSQQEAVRRWIIDLGIEFRDGDGGFLSR